MRLLKLIILFLCSALVPCHADNNLIDRVDSIRPSIVEVKTELTKVMHTDDGAAERTATFTRSGAGIVIDADGIIVTNTHIIINAPFIFVILRDGTKLPAQVLFASQDYDFSFLKILPAAPLKPIEWADSSKISFGQEVIAIGNSDYDNQSILSGHVKGILQSHSQGTFDFLELDLDLYHGDSGGPILDRQGRLLGMVMARRESEQNSSVVIASNKIREQYWKYKRNLP